MTKSVNVTDVGKVTVLDISKLKKMLTTPGINLQHSDFFFCFLVEQGYFSVS